MAYLDLVARNPRGEVVKIQIHKCRVDIPEVTEALAILKAINFAALEGWTNIICESDTQVVIQALNNLFHFPLQWAAAGFIRNIPSFSSFFNAVKFV